MGFHFDYNINFENVHHTEHDGRGGKTDNKSQLPILNYKDGQLITYIENVAISVDTLEDLILAEKIIRNKNEKN